MSGPAGARGNGEGPAPTSDVAVDLGARDPRWAGIREETLEVHGHPVHLLRHTTPDGGTPQLLVHGLGGSAWNWLDVIGGLAGQGEVVACDLPGFGQTPVPAGGSARVAANAGFVRALLDMLGWNRVVLHGGSMGGLIATLVAGRDPGRIERLVLVNPALPGPPRHVFRQPKGVLTRVLPAAAPGLGWLAIEVAARRKTAEQLVDDSIAAVFADIGRFRPALREVFVDNARLTRELRWRRDAIVQGASSIVAMLATRREVLGAVDAITAPTLLIWGDADQLVSRHVIDALVVRRPDWSHHIFVDVGHTPMVEVPEEYVGLVTGWYSSEGSTARRAT